MVILYSIYTLSNSIFYKNTADQCLKSKKHKQFSPEIAACSKHTYIIMKYLQEIWSILDTHPSFISSLLKLTKGSIYLNQVEVYRGRAILQQELLKFNPHMMSYKWFPDFVKKLW